MTHTNQLLIRIATQIQIPESETSRPLLVARLGMVPLHTCISNIHHQCIKVLNVRLLLNSTSIMQKNYFSKSKKKIFAKSKKFGESNSALN